MPFIAGETIGPYRLVEQLGQGGMATVFKAYHARLNRFVAIKALHPAFTTESNFLARFEREAQVVAQLEHPNIVPVYDYAEHEGRPFLVMKFIEGETLKARLGHGPLGMDEMDRIVESVGAALAYAHQQGVLHRDVKPSNVLLTPGGQIYLADFGLARIASAGESTLSSDMMLGTPQYISPEQAQGRRDLDNRADIYSFGVLLYEMLVGKTPFNADTPFSVIHDHIYAPLPLPRSIRPEIPVELEQVLLKALAKERDDRFENVEALLAAWRSARQGHTLADAASVPVALPAVEDGSHAQVVGHVLDRLAGEPPEASPAAGKAAKPRRKRSCLWIGLGFVLLIVLLCGVIGLLGAMEERQAGKTASNTPAAGQNAAVQTPAAAPSTEQAAPMGVQPARAVDALPLPTAIARATAQPDDAQAQMDLALSYAVEGQVAQARQVWDQLKTQFGNDPAQCMRAGDYAAEKHAWLPAAEMYLQALSLTSARPAAPELMDRIYASVYLAAASPDAEAFFGRLPQDELGPGFVDLVRARFALYRAEGTLARGLISRLLQNAPETPGVALLQAEQAIRNDQRQKGIRQLQAIAADSTQPGWVLKVANILLTP